MLNDFDRSHIVIDRVRGLADKAVHLRQQTEERCVPPRAYTRANGDDDPEIRNWIWLH